MIKQAKIKTELLFKIFSIFIIVIIVAFLAALQIFVQPNYQKISPLKLIQPNFWKTVLTQANQRKDIFDDCSNYDDTKKITDSTSLNKNWIVFSDCPSDVDDIHKECLLKIQNTKDLHTTIIDYNSIIDNKGDKIISKLDINYFDQENSRIFFSTPATNKAYIIDYDENELHNSETIKPYLWHDIHLEPYKGNKLEIVGIRKNKNNEQFLLIYSENKMELYLYKIKAPHLIKTKIPTEYNFAKNINSKKNSCIKLENKSDKTTVLFDIESNKLFFE